MSDKTNIDAAVMNEYTERRIRAYLASMVPRQGLSTDEERGRSLIEQIALSAQGDDHPPIRLSANQCADVLDFVASVEPLEPRTWWDDPEDAPSHVTGMTLVLGTLVESLRARTGASELVHPKSEDGEWDDTRRFLHAIAPDEGDVPTLQQVHAILETTAGALATHAQALEMASRALKNIASEGDPERIARVIDDLITPHLSEQIIDTLEELAERIPAAGGQS